ncbi:hypothetical protein A9495_09305 [Brachyspira hampsonii]|uniref:hypothetical protein n=1 Tax=Brachyspira hampsonii TaxID=1287055 RepID=UPI000319A2EF|nr:hypothetical protein [Brachyspira hampsonii]OEJ16252.1 hypothetical protein A9495_09305 [Brachyspira hampsonii]
MSPEELRALIEKLKNENALDLQSIDELMARRQSTYGEIQAYSAMSITQGVPSAEERENNTQGVPSVKEDISKLDNDIDTLKYELQVLL